MTQQELAKKLKTSQSFVCNALKDIKNGDVLKPRVQRVLDAQGKGHIIREFIKEIQ